MIRVMMSVEVVVMMVLLSVMVMVSEGYRIGGPNIAIINSYSNTNININTYSTTANNYPLHRPAIVSKQIFRCLGHQKSSNDNVIKDMPHLQVELSNHNNNHNNNNNRIPYVIHYPNNRKHPPDEYQWMDIYNALGRQRKILLTTYLDDKAANTLIASLLWLAESNEASDPITIYCSIQGGDIRPTLAVYEVMRRLSCRVITINMGLTCGCAALLCAAGTPQHRFAFPNARFLMGAANLEDNNGGSAADIAIEVNEVLKANELFINELSMMTRQPIPQLKQHLKRDFYLSAPEAVAYGIIDQILLPPSLRKVAVYRGLDEKYVGFGQFTEARFIGDKQFDDDSFDSESEEMVRMRELLAKNPPKKDKYANRFKDARCRPPGQNPG